MLALVCSLISHESVTEGARHAPLALAAASSMSVQALALVAGSHGNGRLSRHASDRFARRASGERGAVDRRMLVAGIAIGTVGTSGVWTILHELLAPHIRQDRRDARLRLLKQLNDLNDFANIRRQITWPQAIVWESDIQNRGIKEFKRLIGEADIFEIDDGNTSIVEYNPDTGQLGVRSTILTENPADVESDLFRTWLAVTGDRVAGLPLRDVQNRLNSDLAPYFDRQSVDVAREAIQPEKGYLSYREIVALRLLHVEALVQNQKLRELIRFVLHRYLAVQVRSRAGQTALTQLKARLDKTSPVQDLVGWAKMKADELAGQWKDADGLDAAYRENPSQLSVEQRRALWRWRMAKAFNNGRPLPSFVFYLALPMLRDPYRRTLMFLLAKADGHDFDFSDKWNAKMLTDPDLQRRFILWIIYGILNPVPSRTGLKKQIEFAA